ncbi:ABC transporter permease [Erysipelothrix piscisicarius]|uniref:ABC transporter permease n=1 Tax=Erysipelothrix piscisicarius TaxID=2485784 RepID=A0A3Q8S353_9FIRM|nr:ABC transporter permease [Erysipelothrix piscisicarius]AZK44649.1 ABC transporter permease [Erysipelothrix piscisicarius]
MGVLNSTFISDILIQGFLYGILSMGVLISYKILDIPDLSVDGTYPLGAAVSAILILNGLNPWMALLISTIAGATAGIVTGLFHVKFGISSLLSGILVMTGLYSINLVVAGGKPNIPLFKFETIFSTQWLEKLGAPPFLINNFQLIVMVILVLGIKVIIDQLLTTKTGYLLKVTGDNEQLVTTLGHNVGLVKIFGLALANAIVAFSGGLAVSVNKYFDISLGTGMVVLGLSSVILGTTILGRIKLKSTTMVIFGAIVYRLIVALAIRMGIDAQFMKLITVVIFISAIMLNKIRLPKWKNAKEKHDVTTQ